MRIHPKALCLGSSITIEVTPAHQAASAYYYVPLDVPEGTTSLTFTQDYPKSEQCLIDLGIFDPSAQAFPTRQGFRGWSGGARSEVTLALDRATPGYIPGPLPAGQWMIILGLYRLPTGLTEVNLSARGDKVVRPTYVFEPQPDPIRNGPLWAKGDCQCHTFHSDAQGAPEVLHAQAKKAGLDFLFVTDHNTMTSWEAYFAQASGPDLVLLPGIEITTYTGHGNALGLDRWVDFRLEAPGDEDRLIQEVHAAGGLFSINHDKPVIPWERPVPAIDAMEVWQRHWLMHNDISLAKYDRRLAASRRISAIGGSDWHQPTMVSDDPFPLGTPTTVLHCAELNRAAIMHALRLGHGYVTEGPMGPHLATTITGAPMGSILPTSKDQPLVAETSGAIGDDLVLISSGYEIARHEIIDNAPITIPLPADLPYVRVQIEAKTHRLALVDAFQDWCGHPVPDQARVLRAVSNPHYFGDWQ